MATKKNSYQTRKYTLASWDSNLNWYMLRKSYRDEGASWDYQAPNGSKIGLLAGNVSSYILKLRDADVALTVGAEAGQDDAFTYTAEGRLNQQETYFSDVYYSDGGVLDFANATGAVNMGETVPLYRSSFTTSVTAGYATELRSGVYSHVSNVYSEGTLTIQGAFNSIFNAFYGDAYYGRLDADNPFPGSQTLRNTYDTTNGNLMTVAGVRAENISIEANMTGVIDATIAGVRFQPLAGSDPSTTGKHVLEADDNSFQAFGLLAGTAKAASSSDPITGDGKISLGGTTEGSYNTSIWSGTVNTSVSGVTVKSDMFRMQETAQTDAQGNIWHDVNGGTKTIQYVDVYTGDEDHPGALTAENRHKDFKKTGIIGAGAEETIAFYFSRAVQGTNTVQELETEARQVYQKELKYVALPVENTDGDLEILLTGGTTPGLAATITASELADLYSGYYKLVLDGSGTTTNEIYTGYFTDNSEDASMYPGYLPELIWMNAGTATPYLKVEYGGQADSEGVEQLIAVYVDTTKKVTQKVAYRDQNGNALDSNDKGKTWYVLEDGYDPDSLKYPYEVNVTVSVPVVRLVRSTDGTTFVENVNDSYRRKTDKNPTTYPVTDTLSYIPYYVSVPYDQYVSGEYVWQINYVDVVDVYETDKMERISGIETGRFTDPDFVLSSLMTDISDNTFTAAGVAADEITLTDVPNGVASDGVISASVSDITLSAEYSKVNISSDIDRKDINTGLTAYLETHKNELGAKVNNNTAEAAAISAKTLNISGVFDQTLTASMSKIDTSETVTTYNYYYRTWDYTEYQMQVGADSGLAATAMNFLEKFGGDLSQFYDPVNDKYIDSYNKKGEWTASYLEIDPVSGYLWGSDFSPENPYYIDPATGFYVDPDTGKLYSSKDLAQSHQVFYSLDDKGNKILLHKAGDRMILDDDIGTIYRDDEEYEAKNHVKTFSLSYESGRWKRINGRWVWGTYRDTQVIERSMSQENTALIKNGTTSLKGVSGKSYGLNLTGGTLNVAGNFRGDIFVAGDAEITRNADGAVVVTAADYSAEEEAAGREMYRMAEFSAYGIKSNTINSAKSVFAPTMYVADYVKEWSEETLNNLIASMTMQEKGEVYGIKTGVLTADALGGDIVVYSNVAEGFLLFFPAANQYSNTAAVSVTNLTNDNDGSFDIIGRIISSQDVLMFDKSATTNINLRVSGFLSAISRLENDGSIVRAANVLVFPSQYIFKDREGRPTDDRLVIAAGAQLGAQTVRDGVIAFNGGDDTLIMDSNASVYAQVSTGLGTLNVVFNLNDRLLDESDRNTGVTYTGTMSHDSTVLVTVNVNDVDMSVTDNVSDGSKVYSLIGGADDEFCTSMKVIQVKYQGISTKTQLAHLDEIGSTTIVAEIGYYDGGEWISVESDETGYEFRDINFTAKIGMSDAAQTTYGNYVRVRDTATDKIIYQVHTSVVNETLSVIVDQLPDQVLDAEGNSYYIAPFGVNLSNLRQHYDRENNRMTISWDDNCMDISQTHYQLEYYIRTDNGDGTFTDTNTILREVTSDSPRTSVTLENIESTQTVIWRVRQALGIGDDVVGEWSDLIGKYERPSGLSQTDDENVHTRTMTWRNLADPDENEYYVIRVTIAATDPVTGEITTHVIQEDVTPSATDAQASYVFDTGVLAENEVIAGWEVAITNGAIASEFAPYQDLQIVRTEYAPISNLKAETEVDYQIRLSWTRTAAEDVSYILNYRVNSTGSEGEWQSVMIDPAPSDAVRASYLLDLGMGRYLNADEILEWNIQAIQKNGDEELVSQISTGKTTQKQDTKHTCSTTEVVPPSEVGKVEFSWNSEGPEGTMYELVYGNVTKVVLTGDGGSGKIRDGRVYVTISDKSASTFRVRTCDWETKSETAPGKMYSAGEWKIYEFEEVTNLVQTEYSPETESVTLSFESNVPGSAYRLEYIVHHIDGSKSNPAAYDFAESTKKYLSYTVKDLAEGDTLEWRVTTASEEGYGTWIYEKPKMEITFNETTFCDKPQNTSAEGGKNAAATLIWNPGDKLEKGLAYYEVQYFQSAKYMSASEITAYLESPTAKYAQLEVTNNRITVTGLIDAQYIYWRVRAYSNKGVDGSYEVSDWTMGDAFHVYLDDIEPAKFTRDPETHDPIWLSKADPDRASNQMDLVLSWDPATDDKSGVKNYIFTYDRTEGSAEQSDNIRYKIVYLKDGEQTEAQELTYDPDNGLTINHIEGVERYYLTIENLANGNYDWNLTVYDYQPSDEKIPDTRSGSWTGDFKAPEFVYYNESEGVYEPESEEHPAMTSTMAAAIRDTGGSGNPADMQATLAPVLTWGTSSLIDPWKESLENQGSGVSHFLLTWTGAESGETVTIMVDWEDITEADGVYTYQLEPNAVYDPADKKLLSESSYNWTFQAVDFMGNTSTLAQSDYSSVTGTWLTDDAAPVFEGGTVHPGAYYYDLNLIVVNMFWDDAQDYWYDSVLHPDEDPTLAGSGVKYYTVDYWRLDNDGVRISSDPVSTVVYDAHFSVTLTNADYEYEIRATDYMGNTNEDEVLAGIWQRNDNPPEPPTGVVASETFGRIEALTDGAYAWSTNPNGTDPRLSYVIASADNSLDVSHVLAGFTGDNIEDYEGEFVFTSTGVNTWDVQHIDGQDDTGADIVNPKVYHVTLTTAEDGAVTYTVTFDLANGKGESSEAVLTASRAADVETWDYSVEYAGSDALGFIGEGPFMVSGLTWQEPEQTLPEEILYYSLDFRTIEDRDNPVDKAFILDAFHGDTTRYLDYVSFTETVAGKEWDVTFNVDPAGKVHHLTLADDGSYTMTCDVTNTDGTVTKAILRYGPDAVTDEWVYSAEYWLTNRDLYVWNLTDTNVNGGMESVEDTWTGDTAAPAFRNNVAAVSGTYSYTRDKTSGTRRSKEEVIMSIVNPAIDYKTPGDYGTPGSGIAYYTVAYGGESDAVFTPDEGRAVIALNPESTYTYTFSTTDWAGFTSGTVSGVWYADTRAAEFDPDQQSTDISKSVFTHKDSKMVNTLSWTAATDYQRTGDDTQTGVGVDYYALAITSGTVTDSLTFIGDDFDWFSGDEFTAEKYVRSVDDNGVITFTKTGRSTFGSWTYTYVCKLTEDGSEADNGGTCTYTVTVDNADYSWSLTTVDFVGNTGTTAAQTRGGIWSKDVAAPIFVAGGTAPVTNTFGRAETIGKMSVRVVWSYDYNNTLSVVDPRIASSTENDGSGIQYFNFNYKLNSESEGAWRSLKVPVAAASEITDGTIHIQFNGGIYTAYSEVVDIPVVSDYWTWAIDAVDYAGNAYIGTTSDLSSGIWTRDEAAPRLPDGGTVSTDASYEPLEEAASLLHLTVNWSAAVDDWEKDAQDEQGTGVNFYTLTFTLVGGTTSYTKNVTHVEEQSDYTWTQAALNGDYEWTLTATDNSNTDPDLANTALLASGTIFADTTAPMFDEGTATLKRVYNAGTKVTDLTFEWVEANDVVVPDVPTSGFWKYQVAYSTTPSEETSWITVDITDQSTTDYSFSVPSDVALADGIYTWRIYAYDKAGNKSYITGSASTFIIDTVAPEFQPIEGSTNYYTVTSGFTTDGFYLTVEWAEAYDATSGIGNYVFCYKNITAGEDWTELTLSASTLKQELTGLAGGDYQWALYAVDKAGNKTENTLGSLVLGDIDAPVFSGGTVAGLTSIYDASTKTTTLSFSWSVANDPVIQNRPTSGFASYEVVYKLHGTDDWSAFTTIGTQAMTSYVETLIAGTSSSAVLEDGVYDWAVVAYDLAGNARTITGMNSTFTIDSVSPIFENDGYNTISYTYNPDQKWFDTFNFVWSMADNSVDDFDKYVLSYGYTVDGTFVEEEKVTFNNRYQTQYTYYNKTFKKNAEYSWTLTAYDTAGNYTVLTGADTWISDTKAPVGSFTNLSDEPTLGVEWKEERRWENPLWVIDFTAISAIAEFDLTNTFEDEVLITGGTAGPISYQVRTYGKDKSGNEYREHIFETTESSLILDEKSVTGIGYITGLYNDNVYWQARAVDSFGNATAWYNGKSFQMKEGNYAVTDKTAPSVVTNVAASTSIDSGLLTLSWDESTDAFGVDSYRVDIYNSASSKAAPIATFIAENGETALSLAQSQLANGNYWCAVTSVDCAGNVAAASSKLQFTYDCVAPEFDAESVTCERVPAGIAFTWDAMTDNLAVGNYRLTVMRASGGDIVLDTFVTDTSFLLMNTLPADSYFYTVRAFDAAGNEAETFRQGQFSVSANDISIWNWGSSAVVKDIGNGIDAGTWKILVNGPSADKRNAAAAVTVRIGSVVADSAFGGLDVEILDPDGASIRSFSVEPGMDYSETFYWNESKQIDAEYAVVMTPLDPAGRTSYSMYVTKQDFSASNTLDDTWELARDNDDFHVLLSGSSVTGETIVKNEWIGFSDNIDFRQITLMSDGTYTFSLNSLSSAARATLYREHSSGNIEAMSSAVSDGSSLVMDSLDLDASETYYLSVERFGEDDPAVSTSYNVAVSSVISGSSASPLLSDSFASAQDFGSCALPDSLTDLFDDEYGRQNTLLAIG